MMEKSRVPLNVALWEYSLSNPEKILDYNYFVDIDRLVIPHNSDLHGFESKNSQESNLAEIEKGILKTISDIAQNMEKEGDSSENEQLIDHLRLLMSKPSANLTTFRSFWPVLDMSHSVYSSLDEEEKKEFLKVAVEEFISKRHNVYKAHGYSLSSLQILADANAHKSQGATASHKLAGIFKSFKLKQAKSPREFLDHEMTYGIMEDGIHINDLKPMCKELRIQFQWHEENQRKKPDFFLHLKYDELYFGEAKHKKEGGGGQNDQIKEIIKFIGFSESRPNFGYISFLDGIYFNTLIPGVEISSMLTLNKGQRQSKEINDSLSKNPNNYFLNTEGIKKFLELRLK